MLADTRRKLFVFGPLWAGTIALLGWVAFATYVRNHRRIPPAFPVSVPDSIVGSRLKPGFVGKHVTEAFDVEVVVNSLGMRGPETTREKMQETYRVAIVGDSFAFGWGVDVECSFVGRMRSWFEERSPSLEVLNLGVPGWSPDHVLVWMRNGLFDFAPDLVVVQLCVNDLADLAGDDLRLDEQNRPLSIQPKLYLTAEELAEARAELKREYGVTPEQLVGAMTEQQIHDFVRKVLDRARVRRSPASSDEPVGEIASMSHAEVLRGLGASASLQARFMVRVLEAIEQECSSRGVSLRWMLVDDGSMDVAEKEAIGVVRSWLAERRDAFLDCDTFLPSSDREHFFDGDPHWTTAGHEKAAVALREWLEPLLPK